MNNDNMNLPNKPQKILNNHHLRFKQLLWLAIKIDNLERSIARLRREYKKTEELYTELAKKKYLTILAEHDDVIKLLKHQIHNCSNKKICKQLTLNLFILRQQKYTDLLNNSSLQEQISNAIANDELLTGEQLRYQHKSLVLQARIEVTTKLFKKLQQDTSIALIPHYLLELFGKLQNLFHYLPPPPANKDNKFVENFLNEMVDIDGKPLYQKLCDERLSTLKKYEAALNTTNAFIINLENEEISNDTIMNAVSKLSPKMQVLLAKALRENNLIFEECNQKLDCDIDILIDAMLYTNNFKAVNILFNAGISEYVEYYSSFPLYKAIQHNNRQLALIILQDKNLHLVLKHENDNKKYFLNSLELLVYAQDLELIKLLINNKFSLDLIIKPNKNGHNPIDIATKLNYFEIVELLNTKIKQFNITVR